MVRLVHRAGPQRQDEQVCHFQFGVGCEGFHTGAHRRIIGKNAAVNERKHFVGQRGNVRWLEVSGRSGSGSRHIPDIKLSRQALSLHVAGVEEFGGSAVDVISRDETGFQKLAQANITQILLKDSFQGCC